MTDAPAERAEVPEQRGDFMLLPPLTPTFGIPGLIQQMPRDFIVTRRPVAVSTEPVGHTIDMNLVGRVPGRARRRLRFPTEQLEHLIPTSEEEWEEESPDESRAESRPRTTPTSAPRARAAVRPPRAPSTPLPSRLDVRRTVASPPPIPRAQSEAPGHPVRGAAPEVIPGELVVPPMPPSTFPGVGDSSSVVRRRGGPPAPTSVTPDDTSPRLNSDSAEPSTPSSPSPPESVDLSADTAAPLRSDAVTPQPSTAGQSSPPPLQRRRSRGRVTSPIVPEEDDDDLPPAVKRMLDEIDELADPPQPPTPVDASEVARPSIDTPGGRPPSPTRAPAQAPKLPEQERAHRIVDPGDDGPRDTPADEGEPRAAARTTLHADASPARSRATAPRADARVAPPAGPDPSVEARVGDVAAGPHASVPLNPPGRTSVAANAVATRPDLPPLTSPSVGDLTHRLADRRVDGAADVVGASQPVSPARDVPAPVIAGDERGEAPTLTRMGNTTPSAAPTVDPGVRSATQESSRVDASSMLAAPVPARTIADSVTPGSNPSGAVGTPPATSGLASQIPSPLTDAGAVMERAPEPTVRPSSATSLAATAIGTNLAATIPSASPRLSHSSESATKVRPVLAGRTGIQRRARSRPAPATSVADTVASGRAGISETPAPRVAGPRRVSVPEQVKQALRGSVGEPPSHVTVHEGSEAANLTGAVNAEAFTRDGQIYLAGDAPLDSPRGQELLAHELTHVMQQSGSNGSMPGEHTREGKSLEDKALAVERAMASGSFATVRPTALARPTREPDTPELHHRVESGSGSPSSAGSSRWSAPPPPPPRSQEVVIQQSMETAPDIQRRERDLESSALSRGFNSVRGAIEHSLVSQVEQELLGPPSATRDKDSRYKRLEKEAADLYPYIRARLRAELVRDRERRGRIARDWS